MTDKRAFFKVDVGYLMNPKVAAVAAESPTAVLLHLAATAYAAQHLTDGVAPLALVMRIVGATQDDAELLFKRSLLIDRHDGDVEVHDYLEHQRSAAEAKKLSDAGRKGAEARWSDADGNADANADGMRTPMAREKREKREREGGVRRSPSGPMPTSWAPNDAHAQKARERGIDLATEAESFRNWSAAKDARYVDWDAAFRNWLTKARPTATPHQSSNWDRLPTAAQIRAQRQNGDD